jgi:3,4-dihydroxy-2-butanone 4-phosphate synthase/GTP cyclohydrolase II
MKRADQSRTLREVAGAQLPTKWGVFQAKGFERWNGIRQSETAVALILGDLTDSVPLLRIHSECFTGDVLGSMRCDCGGQLELAMRSIASEGRGLLIYEHQEGRGIGLMSKLRAYGLQEAGLDTIEANRALGFLPDYRDYSLPVAILHHLGIRSVRLLSNNPQKARALVDSGIEVVAELSCEVAPTIHSLNYLWAKKEKMGHSLTLGTLKHEETSKEVSPDALCPTTNCTVGTQVHSGFATIEIALQELRTGNIIIVVDDEDRENEGDLLVAAEKITAAAINFMVSYGRGMVCLAMTGERLDELGLGPMVQDNTALGGTAFTASIDAKRHGITTGISAADRAQTIRVAIDERSGPDDFARPGHVFPLRSRDGGVLERRGHTEAAVDLARLAGLHPSGVICEILNDDGTMARLPDLIRFSELYQLRLITVDDLRRYRMMHDSERSCSGLNVLVANQCASAESNSERPFDAVMASGHSHS